jgi:proline racemase
MTSIYHKIQTSKSFSPPPDWHRIRTIDMHTGGEPLRVILDGLPELKGHNVLEYRQDMLRHHDHLRRALMHEPRGHADMYGCILLPPNDEEGDFGILFLHNEGYSTMCGHAIIGITTLAIEMGVGRKASSCNYLENRCSLRPDHLFCPYRGWEIKKCELSLRSLFCSGSG